MNLIYYAWLYFAALRKFHDTELLFGRFRVSIQDFPLIPRRIDANVTGVTAFPRGDSFVTAYISGPFAAHIAKSRKENPFYLGTLHRLNDEIPILLGAARDPSTATVPVMTAGD